jgi:uncharacterized protein YabE (DUF348 family)
MGSLSDHPHHPFGRFRSQPVRYGAPTLVLLAVVGGGVAYARADKHVTLNVDGETRSVSASARTVGDLLADQGIAVAAHDLVSPGLSDPLRDGTRVVVRYARPMSVTVDGTPRTVWTTELTVEDALRTMGVRARGADVSVSRSLRLGRQGVALSVNTPKTVTLTADRTTRTITTTAASVAGLLSEAGVWTRPLDRVTPAPTATLTNGARVTLERIDKSRVAVPQKLWHRTHAQHSDALAAGTRRVRTHGRDGKITTVFELVTVDGRLIAKTLVERRIDRAPVDEVVVIGTKRVSRASHRSKVTTRGGSSQAEYVGGGRGLNWAALADCESGGNPRAVSPGGTYRGLYQFSRSTWRSVGGFGDPIDASPAEQTKRAQILYDRTGPSSWPVCGRRL